LQACYFEVKHTAFLSERNIVEDMKTLRGADLLEVAKRSIKVKQNTPSLSPSSETTDHIFAIAKTFTGRNAFHMYKPPFGLEKFDAGRLGGNEEADLLKRRSISQRTFP